MMGRKLSAPFGGLAVALLHRLAVVIGLTQ
jgi:hypothetical protein